MFQDEELLFLFLFGEVIEARLSHDRIKLNSWFPLLFRAKCNIVIVSDSGAAFDRLTPTFYRNGREYN